MSPICITSSVILRPHKKSHAATCRMALSLFISLPATSLPIKGEGRGEGLFLYLTSTLISSWCFTFGKAQASLALRSLNQHLLAVDDVDALNRSSKLLALEVVDAFCLDSAFNYIDSLDCSAEVSLFASYIVELEVVED